MHDAVPRRGLGFSLTHRPSVGPGKNAVRETCITIANNFLNVCSGMHGITAGLFVQLFRRTFGFDEKHLPLFIFMAGSPFFLKNFMHTLGHFDIYGCLFAICLLLIPARSLPHKFAKRRWALLPRDELGLVGDDRAGAERAQSDAQLAVLRQAPRVPARHRPERGMESRRLSR